MCTPKCSVKKCHHVYGCPENNATTVQAMISGTQVEEQTKTKHARSFITRKIQLKSTILFSEKTLTFSLSYVGYFHINMLFITGNSHTAQGLPNTTEYYSRQTWKNQVISDNHQSFTKNVIKPMHIYLFVGFGVGFILFIFIMIIELYRMFKVAKRKIIIEEPCDESRFRGESTNQFSGTLCKSSSRQSKRSRLHQSVDFEYAEINEVVEMQDKNNSNVTSNGRHGNSKQKLVPLRQSHNS